MAEYIDKQAALDALSAHKEVLLYIMDKCGVTEEVNKTLEIICNVPSADAVEVVRCKDCKHWIPYDWMFSEVWKSQNIDDYAESEIGCTYCDMSMGAMDYCSRGERKYD